MSNGNQHTTRGYQYEDEELLEAVRDVAKRHGKVTPDLFEDEPDTPSVSVVVDRFSDPEAEDGGWIRAKRKAGVGGDGRSDNARPRVYSDADMIEFMQQCQERYGTVSQPKIDQDDDFCSSGAIVKRFGSWDAAKREAGVA